jgi:hypothetical protein
VLAATLSQRVGHLQRCGTFLAASRPAHEHWLTNPPYDSRRDKGNAADRLPCPSWPGMAAQRPPRAARSKTQRSQKRAHSSTTCHLVPQASDSDASSSCVCCVRLPVSNHSGCTRSAARARRRSWPRLNAGDRVFAVLLGAFFDKLPYRIVDAALQYHADPHTQVLHSARVIMATSKHDARFGLAQLRARNCMP